MRKKPTSNKAEKHDEEMYLKQQEHKDKEKRERTSELYKKGEIRKGKKSSFNP